jgi:hypothetical protein
MRLERLRLLTESQPQYPTRRPDKNMKSRENDPAAVLRTGTVSLFVRVKRDPPPAPTQLQDLNGRHGKPRHKNLKQRCGFCGECMRSMRQRTGHASECKK